MSGKEERNMVFAMFSDLPCGVRSLVESSINQSKLRAVRGILAAGDQSPRVEADKSEESDEFLLQQGMFLK